MSEVLKRKYKELELFNGYSIDLLNKRILFFVKSLSMKQKDFIRDNIKEILQDKEQTIYFLMQLVDIKREELDLILEEQEALQYLLKIAFSDSDINLNFCNLMIERLELFKTHSNDLFFIFISILVSNYNYKILELENLPFIKVVDLCIKETSARNDTLLFDILVSQCEESIKIYSSENKKELVNDYTKLLNYLKENFVVQKQKAKKEKSQFDLLGEL